jgi:hypothetical protein
MYAGERPRPTPGCLELHPCGHKIEPENRVLDLYMCLLIAELLPFEPATALSPRRATFNSNCGSVLKVR